MFNFHYHNWCNHSRCVIDLVLYLSIYGILIHIFTSSPMHIFQRNFFSFYLSAHSHFFLMIATQKRCAFQSVHLLIVLFDAHRWKLFFTVDIVWKCEYEKNHFVRVKLNNREHFSKKVNCEVQIVQFSRTLAVREISDLIIVIKKINKCKL